MLNAIGAACYNSMMTLIKNRLWCAVLLFTVQFGAVVQAQTQFGFDFNTSNYPAWDISGTYVLSQPITGVGGLPVPLVYTVPITQNSKGKLSGTGWTILNVDGQYVATHYTVKGSVSGGGNDTRVNFTVTLKGQDFFYGILRNFKGSITYKANIDPNGLTLSGTARGSFSISGSSSSQIKVDTDIPLPAGVNGSWTVVVGVVALKSFVGSGTINVAAFKSPDLPGGWPAARILPAQVNGSYSNSKNLVSSSITGINTDFLEGKGNNLSLKFQPATETEPAGIFPTKMNGKVLGQKIKFQSP